MRKRIAYLPGRSFLHRLHPLVKLGWLVYLTVLVFALRSPWTVAGLLLGILAAFVAARLPLGNVRGVRLFVTTALMLAALQIIFVDEGAALLTLGPVTVTDEGLMRGLYIGARFLSVVLISYLFVLTTSPNDLAYGLMQAGLPYRYGFTLVTALRLVPVFEREAQIVYRAQVMRGALLDRKTPRGMLALLRQFTLPMLVSALGKVDALAISMEGRCFGRYPTRTYLREVHFTRRDGLALVLMILAVGALIALKLFTSDF